MRLSIVAFFCFYILLSCSQNDTRNCYPKQPVAKTVILAADTTILSRYFNPDSDTTHTYPVFNGIGFVKVDGTPVHKPLKTLVLSRKEQEEFLKILRPIPNMDEGLSTSCVPFYRHAVLFYDKDDKLIGQMHICFDCSQVQFLPEPDCLNYFDNVRLEELYKFFKKNNIPMLLEN